MKNHQIMILFPFREFVINTVTDDYKGICIGFRMGLHTNLLNKLGPMFFSVLKKKPIWDLDDELYKAVIGFAGMFNYITNHLNVENKSELISDIYAVFLQTFQVSIKHMYESDEEEAGFTGKQILQKFLMLLHKNYKKEHQVSFYADALCISSKYLNNVIKTTLRTTPKFLIDHRIAVESVYMLTKTGMSIKEISDELGFPTQSYFGRFFKRIFDVSPNAARANPSTDILMKKLS